MEDLTQEIARWTDIIPMFDTNKAHDGISNQRLQIPHPSGARIIRSCLPYIQLARPHHYHKNLLILAPSLLGGNTDQFVTSSIVAAAFSLLTSSIYCLNDVCDADHDRNNPSKRMRPIASGRVGIQNGLLFSLVLAMLAFFIVYCTESYALPLFIIYLIINVFYSMHGKDVPILDVCLVSSGFVLRFALGCAIVQSTDLLWLTVPIYAGSVSLALGKRIAKIQNARSSNRTPQFYTKGLLTGLQLASSNAALLAFAWVLIADGSPIRSALLLNNMSVLLILLTATALVSRTTYLMVFRATEPAQAFFRDRVTVFFVLLEAGLTIVSRA